MHLRPPYLPCPGLTSGSTLPSSAPALPLQVPILKQHLKGKLIGGQEWRAGSKKRDDLIADFRCGCGADVAAGLGPCLVGRGTAAAAQQTCQCTCSAVELMSACRSVPHYPASNRLPACLPACRPSMSREYLGLRAVEPTSPASSLAVSLSSWSIKAAPQVRAAAAHSSLESFDGRAARAERALFFCEPTAPGLGVRSHEPGLNLPSLRVCCLGRRSQQRRHCRRARPRTRLPSTRAP